MVSIMSGAKLGTSVTSDKEGSLSVECLCDRDEMVGREGLGGIASGLSVAVNGFNCDSLRVDNDKSRGSIVESPADNLTSCRVGGETVLTKVGDCRGSKTVGLVESSGDAPAILGKICKKIVKGPAGRKKPKNRSRAVGKQNQTIAQATQRNSQQEVAKEGEHGGSGYVQPTLDQVWEREATSRPQEHEDLNYMLP